MTGIRIRIHLPYSGFDMLMCDDIIKLFLDKDSAKQEGNWIEVQENEPGIFSVVDDSMTVKNGDWVLENTALSFSKWDGEVEDLDAGGSDESKSYDMSSYLKWQDVYLTLTSNGGRFFRAPSIERLKEALNHVAICAWSPGNI